MCVVNRSRPIGGVGASRGLPHPFGNDAEVPEFGHQSFGVERQEIGHADQSITRHRPEMRKPSALNAWKIERGEAPNDIEVRKLRTQDCPGQCPPVLHASQTRGGNLVGHPADITDRSWLAGAGVQQTGFLDQLQHCGGVARIGHASAPCEHKLADVFEIVQALGYQTDVERFIVTKSVSTPGRARRSRLTSPSGA